MPNEQQTRARVVISLDQSFYVTINILMHTTPTFTVTEFKARCLDILDRLGSGKLDRVEVTKRGKVMAVLTPPPAQVDDDLFGCLKDQTFVPDDFDLTKPAASELPSTAHGILHQ